MRKSAKNGFLDSGFNFFLGPRKSKPVQTFSQNYGSIHTGKRADTNLFTSCREKNANISTAHLTGDASKSGPALCNGSLTTKKIYIWPYEPSALCRKVISMKWKPFWPSGTSYPHVIPITEPNYHFTPNGQYLSTWLWSAQELWSVKLHIYHTSRKMNPLY